jgi:RimJ/RimL family protein N-acetyltransferase
MTLTVTIPSLETDRLILRAPSMADCRPFMAFLGSDRSRFVGGPVAERVALRAFGHAVGLWVLRGYSMHIMTLKGSDQPIGWVGPWYPLVWTEPELSWSLWDAAHEGKGYITEAMRALLPTVWDLIGTDTAVSVIDTGNVASRRVAEALGAAPDADATDAANREGSPFYEADSPAIVYRHRRPG